MAQAEAAGEEAEAKRKAKEEDPKRCCGATDWATAVLAMPNPKAVVRYGAHLAKLPHGFRGVCTPGEFEENVTALFNHTVRMIKCLKPGSSGELYVGSTGVMKHARRAFAATDPATWKYSGPGTMADRMSVTHRDERRFIFAILCVGAADVPDALRAHELDQRHLAASYEAALARRLKKERAHCWWSLPRDQRDGGGGQTDTAKAGHVVYVGFKLVGPGE